MLTFLILLILAWSFILAMQEPSLLLLVTFVAPWIGRWQLQGTWPVCCLYGLSLHPAIGELFLCQPLPISIR